MLRRATIRDGTMRNGLKHGFLLMTTLAMTCAAHATETDTATITRLSQAFPTPLDQWQDESAEQAARRHRGVHERGR